MIASYVHFVKTCQPHFPAAFFICILSSTSTFPRSTLFKELFQEKNDTYDNEAMLDFWLISDALQEDVEAADIIPSPKSDHSAISNPVFFKMVYM